MAYRIQQRRDTAANWAEMNPILLEGEMGLVTDNPNQYKIGDGVHTWNELSLRGYTGTISQELGEREDAVVSQKVVSEKFSETEQKLSDIGSKVRVIDSLVGSVMSTSDYVGYYCSNVNYGNISDSNAEGNAILISVNKGEVYQIIGDSIILNGVQIYSGIPSVENNVGYIALKDNVVTIPTNGAYMLISINPSVATDVVVKLMQWIDGSMMVEGLDQKDNIGSVIKKSRHTLKFGAAGGSNTTYPISLISEGGVLESYVKSDKIKSYILLTNNGKSLGAFEPNKVNKAIINKEDEFLSGSAFGFWILADQILAEGEIDCVLRVVGNDGFSISRRLSDTESKSIKNSESLELVNEAIVTPINNAYVKNWEDGNKLAVRLYVENKELAIEDGLFIRQFFKLSDTNCGFNFGNKNNEWALSIAPFIGAFDAYETTDYTCDGIVGKYGKIAIRMDWSAMGDSTSKGISKQTECNLQDVAFDWSEFVKPIKAAADLPKDYVSEDKLTKELRDKINSSNPTLSGYELFSLGDSLSAGGIWQSKVAEKTGCIFDQNKNNKGGAMLSIGGTKSFGETFDNVLWRAKDLVEQGYISNGGENAIVILENVNDGYNVFDENVKSIIPSKPIEGYAYSDFGENLLRNISDKAALNAVLRLTTTSAGKNLRIKTLPTKAGNVTLKVGWAGPGTSNYNIYVEPQATEAATLTHVLDKILEYSYTGITDVLGEDGMSVDFSSGYSDYLPIVTFVDTDNTGMTCEVTDNPSAKGSVAMYFIGDSISEWSDTSKWQKGITYSQGWKSTIELLQRAYPKLHIFVSMFPAHNVTAANYLLPNGSYDSAAYNTNERMVVMRKMTEELKKIADFYSVPFMDVFGECGIGINNILSYYNETANVHPKNEGYYRFGETVATILKRYVI